MLAFAGMAAAQEGCPAMCQGVMSAAYRTSSGVVDCCLHDYERKEECRWSGTGVTFRRATRCGNNYATGEFYNVIGQFRTPATGLFQTDKGQALFQCRCPNYSGKTTPSLGVPNLKVDRTKLTQADIPCPATCSGLLSASFDNALGGPADCCKFDYSKGRTCSWGGTPVSFNRVRTCQADGKTYSVIEKLNSQGQGAPQCRCPNAVASAAQVKVFNAKGNSDISGADIPCDGKSFCKVCGLIDEVKAACIRNAACVAFTFAPAGDCGYLKSSSAKIVSRNGWVTYAP